MTTNNGGFAFPGLSNYNEERIANKCYAIADAMIDASGRKNES